MSKAPPPSRRASGDALRVGAQLIGILQGLRALVEIVDHAVGAAIGDGGLHALLEGGGARRVIAAHRRAGDADPAAVEIDALFHPVDHRADRLFEIMADRPVIFALALSRPVEGQGRDAALEEQSLVDMLFLLGRIHAGDDEDHRLLAGGAHGLAQIAVEMLALERDGDPLAGRRHVWQRERVTLDGLGMRRLHLLHVVREIEFREMIFDRGGHEMHRGRRVLVLGEAGAPDLLVDGGALAPGLAPIVPSIDRMRDLEEIRHRHAGRRGDGSSSRRARP